MAVESINSRFRKLISIHIQMSISSAEAASDPAILRRIPLELREKVYEYSLAIGAINILATCKQINAEASKIAYTSGWLCFYQDTIYIPKGMPNYLKAANTDLIQNVEITIRFEKPDTVPIPGLETSLKSNSLRPESRTTLYPFVGPRLLNRKICIINFTNCPLQIQEIRTVSRTLEILDFLVDFETLIFRVQPQEGHPYQTDANLAEMWKLVPFMGLPLPANYVQAAEIWRKIPKHKYHQGMYHTANARLGTHYGPSIERKAVGVEVGYLEYHPRAYRKGHNSFLCQILRFPRCYLREWWLRIANYCQGTEDTPFPPRSPAD